MMHAEDIEAGESELVAPIHPGEILREDFLKPLGMSAYKLAQHLGVPQQRMADLVAGRRGISADTALRLGRFFHGDAQRGARFWLNLQARHDLEVAVADADRVARIEAILPLAEH